jgi:hypothetical protein
MSNAQRGRLILQEVPAGDVEKKVVMLLLKFAKNASVETVTEKVRNLPYTISNDIAAEKAALILEAFQKIGATAAFVPQRVEKPAAEPFRPAESEPRFTFRPPETAEENPLPAPPKAQKNGMRRLATLLVTLLLILSLGYLSWQLWPVFGDQVLELISHLKQLL